MGLATERSTSSSVDVRTPEKRPSRATTDTGTRRTIGRSRRRRPISTPSSSSNATMIVDDLDGKENCRDEQSRRKVTKTKAGARTPMRSRGETNRNSIYADEDEQFSSFETKKSPVQKTSDNELGGRTRICEVASRDFEKALLRISVSSSLWSDFPKLAQTLVLISIAKSSTIESLGLDEHASALLVLSRKLIKDVSMEASGKSESKSQKRNVSVKDNLFVVVHILRSIAFALSEEATVERKEALLKMFFHLISSSRKNEEECYNSITLAGYEGLTKVLSNYHIQQCRGDGKEQIISFALISNKNDSSYGLNQRILFAVPSTARRRTKGQETGSMTTRQLCTIAFQTTMAVTKAILSQKDNQLLPYENLGLATVGKFDFGKENTIMRWHQIALDLLQQVHRPWLMMLAKSGVHEREVGKEVISYSKGIYRLLWDAASTRQSFSDASRKMNRKIERDSLELRKRAILHLLIRTGISKLDLLIRKTSIESGCSYAWKAASVFVQQMSSESDTDKGALLNYYRDIDTAFADLNTSNPHIPMGFVEYKIQRSLHLEPISSLSDDEAYGIDQTDIREDEILNGNYRILLQMLNYGIRSRNRIRNHLNKIEASSSIQASKSDNSVLEDLEKIIYEFNWQVVHRMDEIHSDSMNRILKAFCNLSFHKTLFLAMKGIDFNSPPSHSIFIRLETELLVIATILAECLGPLVSAYLNLNPQKVTQLADLMMECFLRPLSLYEQLSMAAEDEDRRYYDASLNVSKYITEILTDDSMRPEDFVLPIQCIEKAAKSIYAIARRRNDGPRIGDSIPPLICSMKLYKKLDSLNGLEKDYQLSSRLFTLSSALQSMEMVEESFFIRCLIIDYESGKNSVDLTESAGEEILLTHLVSKSGGFLPVTTDNVPVLPQIIRSMCRQMAIDLINTNTSNDFPEESHSFDDFSVDSAMELLFEAYAEEAKTVRAPTCLESIEKMLGFDRPVTRETRIMHVLALAEIIFQFGNSLQQLSQELEISETQLESILHNFSRLQGLLEVAISNLGVQCQDFFEGMIGLVLSASIVPSFSMAGNVISPDWEKEIPLMLLEVAKDTANESAKKLEPSIFSDANCEDDICWRFLYESLSIAVRHFVALIQRKITGKNVDDSIFDDCINVAERLVGFQAKNRNSPVLMRAFCWTIWMTVYLQNELENRCYRDKAAVFSLWALALTEKLELNQNWFRAVAMANLSRKGSLLCLNESISTHVHDKNAQKGSANWIFETEFRLCKLRVAAWQSIESGRNAFHSHMQHAQDIRTELEEFAVDRNSSLFLLYTWVLSTAHLVQTDIASIFGCYSVAMKASHMCQKNCQTILRRISFGVINSGDWITAMATSTVLQIAAQRYIELFSRRPKFYYRVGDHRKALAYTRSVLEYLKIDPTQVTPKDGEGYLREEIKNLLEATSQSRLFLQMNAWSSNPEVTMQQFSDIQPHDFRRQQLNDSNHTMSSVIDSVQDMITVGDILYGESISKRFDQQFYPFFDEAVVFMSQRAHHLQIDSLRIPPGMEQHLGIPILDHVKLRDIRRLRDSPHESNKESKKFIHKLCSEIEESEFVLPEDKGWAFYYVGLLDIEAARCSGALQELWNDNQIIPTRSLNNDENIRSARYHLTKALLCSSEASEIFRRNVLRSLALVEGPDTENIVASSAGILILRSIGQSLRRKLQFSIDGDLDSPKGETLKALFEEFDGPFKSEEDRENKIQFFFENLATQTPENWAFVATTICPSGEVLASIIRKKNPNEFSISTKCIFPSRAGNAYDEIMKPLDSILARVQQHLDGVDLSTVSKVKDREAIKRRWWDQRNKLDAEMRDLLEDAESSYFTKIFEIQGEENCSNYNIEEFPCGNLSSQFDAAISDASVESTCKTEKKSKEKVDLLMKLTVPKLKDRLISSGADKSQFRKLRKADLIELLIQIEDENMGTTDGKAGSSNHVNGSRTSQTCLFLILDENLHRFPFEGMPILKGKTVCRIPCLSFVLATMQEIGPKHYPSIDPETTSYILNPENNLQATQDRLLPEIQKISSSHGWNWDSVIGEIPPPSFFSKALRQKDGLMMYFGHGGAQVCFSRRKVDDLLEQRGADICRATILLMGCSSGKLISINRKHSKFIEETPLYYEPEGVALSYLCAGAPCVIGNLWDVTDNDIDRFSIALMEEFFNSNTQGKSLAQSLSISRSVCKLKHLVGCAPVCYGIPVYLQPK